MRIVFPLFLALASCLAAAPVLPPLLYAVVSDTQKPADDPLTGLREVVEEVNQLAPAFVLMPGDLTNSGSVAEYENVTPVIRGFSSPVYALPGNHEGPAGQGVYRSRFKEFFGEPTYSHQQIGRWHLIRLDSLLFHDGKLDHEGGVDADQLAWLKDTLATIPKDEPIIVSQHHPLRYASPQTSNEEDLLALFAEHYLPYTVTGHLHANNVFQDFDAIWHIVTSSVSFSSRPKVEGTGYRLVSTIGRELWTAWVDLADPVPARPLGTLRLGESTAIATDAKQLLLRVSYSGSGQLVFRATEEAVLPELGDRALVVNAKGDAFRVGLPESKDRATAVIPLPEACTKAFVAAGGLLTALGELEIEGMALWETTATWQHVVLKKPGETRLQVRILSPKPGAELARGRIPVVAMVEGMPAQAPRIQIGSQTGQSSDDFVSILFLANGLQSKSHGFRNCVYVNGDYLTDIEPNRDVTQWEWFAFPIPATRWHATDNPTFRLTAGTPEDGSGANPPANNEDYQAQSLVLLNGAQPFCDPALPVEKIMALGDNGKTPRTLVDCRPTQTFSPRRWRAVLQVVDTTTLAPGATKVHVTWGAASAEVPVAVP
jgi:hypothetical protein